MNRLGQRGPTELGWDIDALARRVAAFGCVPITLDGHDLEAIDATHLFPAHVTWIGFRRGTLLRRYMYDFAQALAPHLDRRLVDRAHRAANAAEVAQMFEGVALPER